MVSSQSTPSSRRIDFDGAVAELAKLVHGDRPLSQTLQRVVELTKQVVPDAVDVSVTLLGAETPRTVAFTGGRALELDERQYEAGYGPCMEAATVGHTVLISTRCDVSYRDFSRTAFKDGMTHMVCVPLSVPGRVLGALNVYLSSDPPPSDHLVTLAETFAVYAAAGLANATLHQAAVDRSQQMEAALTARSIIEQAKGILMAQSRCGGDAAFTQLAETARRQHLKLRDAAAAIVTDINADASARRAAPGTSVPDSLVDST